MDANVDLVVLTRQQFDEMVGRISGLEDQYRVEHVRRTWQPMLIDKGMCPTNTVRRINGGVELLEYDFYRNVGRFSL